MDVLFVPRRSRMASVMHRRYCTASRDSRQVSREAPLKSPAVPTQEGDNHQNIKGITTTSSCKAPIQVPFFQSFSFGFIIRCLLICTRDLWLFILSIPFANTGRSQPPTLHYHHLYGSISYTTASVFYLFLTLHRLPI